MLINLSNHPSDRWGEGQKAAAEKDYGIVRDMQFPAIDPCGDEIYVSSLAEEYLGRVLDIAKREKVTVHIMGEMNFTVALVTLLKSNGITCVASTTNRIVEENSKGEKIVTFKFERFRKY